MRSLLSVPWIYDLAQYAMRGTRYRRRIAGHVGARAGDRVLDVGCGTGTMLECLPEVDYVGFDMSPSYVRACQRRYEVEGASTAWN